jgi:hypothetical protein
MSMEERTRPKKAKVEDGTFLTPTFQALTIGVPFCVFKLLFGLLALRMGAPSASFSVFGWLVIAWAWADLLMNLARVFFHQYLDGTATKIGVRIRQP